MPPFRLPQRCHRDPTQEAVLVVVRVGLERSIQIRPLFPIAAERPRGEDRDLARILDEVAAAMTSKPQAIALTGADAEYSQLALEGARENAQKYGSRSSTIALIRRIPSTLPPSCGRSRPRARIPFTWPHTRLTRGISPCRLRRGGHRRNYLAAVPSDCSLPRSRRS